MAAGQFAVVVDDRVSVARPPLSEVVEGLLSLTKGGVPATHLTARLGLALQRSVGGYDLLERRHRQRSVAPQAVVLVLLKSARWLIHLRYLTSSGLPFHCSRRAKTVLNGVGPERSCELREPPPRLRVAPYMLLPHHASGRGACAGARPQ